MKLKPETQITAENVGSLKPGDRLRLKPSDYQPSQIFTVSTIDEKGVVLFECGGKAYSHNYFSYTFAPPEPTAEQKLEFTIDCLTKAWVRHDRIAEIYQSIADLKARLREEEEAYRQELKDFYTKGSEYNDDWLITEEWFEVTSFDRKRVIGSFLPWEDCDGPDLANFIPFLPTVAGFPLEVEPIVITEGRKSPKRSRSQSDSQGIE